MPATFIDALKVPAIISTLRKIQLDSGDALRVLHGYYQRSQNMHPAPAMNAAEEAALDEVSKITLEQTITALSLFAFAHQAFLFGGVLAGQCAQAFISINSMAAPKRQIVNPGQAVMKAIQEHTQWEVPSIPGPGRRQAARFFGLLAQVSGYLRHEGAGQAMIATSVKSVPAATKLVSFMAVEPFSISQLFSESAPRSPVPI